MPRKPKKVAKNLKGTGSIRRRKNGTWEGQYWFEGKRHSIYDGDYNVLRSRLNEINKNLLENAHVEESQMTLGEWLDIWLAEYSKPVVRQSTYISYGTYIRRHLKPAMGDVPLKKLTIASIQSLFNDLASGGRKDGKCGGLAPKSLRNIRNMLNLVFTQAIANGHLARNPITSIKLPKVQKQEMRVLSIDEQSKVEAASQTSAEIQALGIIVCLYTGMRIGELLALQWADIDFPAGTLQIRNSLRRQNIEADEEQKSGKRVQHVDGNKTAIVLGSVKTQKSRRIIYLPDKALKALKDLKTWQVDRRKILGRAFNSLNFVLCSELGQPIDARYYQDVFHRVVRRAGVAKANFHCLRHTFATRALEHNMDLNALADILGHAAPSTTLNMYGHTFDYRKKKAMMMFNDSQEKQ